MKKITLVFTVFMLCVLCGCTESQLIEDQTITRDNSEDTDEPCVYTQLIAGQHHVAGSVSVDIDGDNLIITYASNGDWVIGTTHLEIGNCDEDWAPLTNSGNPQIGQFEYTEPYSSGPYEVVYIISLEGLGDHYCFAAHAEVVGPTGEETAWAEGTQFEGNGWAMYVESLLSECDEDDDGNTTPF